MKIALSKKMWLFIGCIAVLIGLQSNIFTFRKSEESLHGKLAHQQASLHFHTYQKEGRTIHYAQLGNDSLQPVLLMLHGSPGALDAYLDYLADTALSSQAVLIAADRPGFGYSDFGLSLASVARQASLLEPLLQKFARQRLILVGHSYGGPLIARLAMDYPELVDGLIMIAPSIDPDLEPGTWWRKVLNVWGLRWLLPPALRVCNQEIIPLKSDLKNMLSDWPNVRQPVIVIQGEADKLVPKGNADFAKRVLVNSESVEVQIIEGGNHFILWSRQPIIKKAIRKML